MGRHFACIVLRIMRTTRSCSRKGHFAFIIYGLFCRVTSAYRSLEIPREERRLARFEKFKILHCRLHLNARPLL